MTAEAELSTLRRRVDDVRTCIAVLRTRYGDAPAIRRLSGDLDRFDLDVAELTELTSRLPPEAAPERRDAVYFLDDRPPDPSVWADADDEGVGGYHR